MGDWIENQVFRPEDSWRKRDEREKEDVVDAALTSNKILLRAARENIDGLYSLSTESGAVIGKLYFLAFQTIGEAVNKASIRDSDISDKLEDLQEEFFEALKLEDGRQFTPLDMFEWGKKAEPNGSLGRTPRPMQDVLDERGDKVLQLITFAYSGTEAVNDGSGGSETPSITNEG